MKIKKSLDKMRNLDEKCAKIHLLLDQDQNKLLRNYKISRSRWISQSRSRHDQDKSRDPRLRNIFIDSKCSLLYCKCFFFTILQILPDVCASQDSTQFVPVWAVHSVLKQPENKHCKFHYKVIVFIQYYFVYLLKIFILLLKFVCNLLEKLKFKWHWKFYLSFISPTNITCYCLRIILLWKLIKIKFTTLNLNFIFKNILALLLEV